MRRIRNIYAYSDPFEVDNGSISLLVMMKNNMGKLRNKMPGIAFTSNVEIPLLVLRKSLQPIH